ncbi:indoleacetamide hydrolase [Devosia sp. FKR38]|uniref:indoleacetamide hydrolase n=1 Tax=Devosia sp. FKR38 TaxID=2562312 RepID=UPI0010C019EF|nr:indoleacetamide hydrolase [Devosia sp. FKR38]
MVQLYDLSASQVIRGLNAGDFSTLELVDTLVARCDERRALNAFVELDTDAIRNAALAADRDREGGHVGALAGLPVTFKDNIAVRGQRCAAGTRALNAYRPAQDAAVVQRLLSSGAIAFGRSGMHELALGATSNNKAFGAVHNPHRLDHVPGGSSGGTGSAVAARLVPAGIGTDTGGSVRVPAALCGVHGFRPSTGRWPTKGIVPLSASRDTPGPIARSVEDLVLLDQAVTGDWSAAPGASIKGLRLGIPQTRFWSALTAEVETACRKALDTLVAEGAVLVEVDVAALLDLVDDISFVIAMFETRAELAQFVVGLDCGPTYQELVAGVAGNDVRAIFAGAGADPATYHQALTRGLPALRAQYSAAFADNGLDAMVFPTVPIAAPLIGADEVVMIDGQPRPTFQTLIRNTDPGACAGIPGISLNCGATSDNLPIGLAFDADFGADRRLLGLGLAAERFFPAAPLPG